MSDHGTAPPPPPPPPGGSGGYNAPPPYGPAGGTPPSNNLVLAILGLLCCWPIGIPAVVFAAQVNGKWNAGDQAGAVSAADKAKKFAIGALVLGVVWIIIAISTGLLSALTGTSTSSGLPTRA